MPELSPTELNALRDFLETLCPNLSLALSEQLNRDLALEALSAEAIPIEQALNLSDTVVQTTFSLSAPGTAETVFIFTQDAGHIFADLIEGGDGTAPPEMLNDAQITALSEAMSGLARGMATVLTNLAPEPVELEACATSIGNVSLPPVFARDGNAIQVHVSVSVPGLLDTELTFLFTPECAQTLLAMSTAGEEAQKAETDSLLSEDDIAAMLSDLSGPAPEAAPAQPASVSPAPTQSGASAPANGGAPPFSNFPTGGQDFMPRGMELIMDIPLDVTVELGRVRMLIKDVLELASGSIVELDRVAGEPVDLLVNGRLVAKGEVVVIEDNFGVRITEIISPVDRVAGLGKGR